MKSGLVCAAAILALVVAPALAGDVQANVEVAPVPLQGWVDMHTHPMAHLGFGGKLLHGAPDLGIVVPAIPEGVGCHHYAIATNRREASREDRAIHGGWDLFNNWCGDTIREAFIRGLEGELDAQVKHQSDGALGFPDYNYFPAHNDLTHQQMWVDWIHRTYQGGLRVMVALAVNNRTLASAVMGTGDINGDDAASVEIQIQQMRVMFSQHGWMEIARTPEDLRRIVGEGRLAVILGVEVDNIGNMQWQSAVSPLGGEASETFVRSELQHLWDLDVRYIFPVHVVDNKFGGTAIYQDQFNTSNYHQNGVWWDIACAPAGSGIAHQFIPSGFDLAYAVIKVLKLGMDPLAAPPPPPVCSDPQQWSGGHENAKDLTPLGEFALEEMMRMGFLIDVDHMSARATQEALAIAEANDYPVNAGHNGPRVQATGPDADEYDKTDGDYARIAALRGMVGLGSGAKASDYVGAYQHVSNLVDGMQLAIGTDANGMVILPGPDPAAASPYDATFTRLTDGESGTATQTWDITVDGVANYGLFADYVKTWPSVGMTPAQQQAFFSTAEGFARMWERVAVAQAAMIPTPPTADAGGPYAVDEGSTVALNAGGTTDPNQDASTLTYEWDFDADGAYDDATGATPSYAAADDAVVTVALRVTDGDGMTGTDTATITIANVAPTATLVQLPPTLVFEGLSASFQFTSVFDPSAADVAAGFSFTVDCRGDGSLVVGPTASDTATCAYPDAGTFTVRGSIRDKDGGVGIATTTVTVLSPAQAMDAIGAMIEALRASGALNRGQATALLAKLAEARAKYEAGRSADALHLLDVLLHQVETFGRTGVLTAAQSAELAFWINQLILSIHAG